MIISIVNVLSILLMLCVIPTVWLVYRKKITFFNGVFLGTFLFLMSFVCSMYCIHIEYGYSPADVILGENLNSVISAYSSVPGITEAQIHSLTLMVDEMRKLYTVLLPAVLVLGNLMWVYIIFMVSKGILAIFRKDVSGFAKFCDLKMPKMAILLSLLSVILSRVVKSPQLSYAFLNFTSIIIVVSSVCGLSAVDYAFRKKLKISVLRTLIYIVVMFFFSFVWGTILPVVGMADAFVDFRKIRQKPADKE